MSENQNNLFNRRPSRLEADGCEIRSHQTWTPTEDPTKTSQSSRWAMTGGRGGGMTECDGAPIIRSRTPPEPLISARNETGLIGSGIPAKRGHEQEYHVTQAPVAVPAFREQGWDACPFLDQWRAQTTTALPSRSSSQSPVQTGIEVTSAPVQETSPTLHAPLSWENSGSGTAAISVSPTAELMQDGDEIDATGLTSSIENMTLSDDDDVEYQEDPKATDQNEDGDTCLHLAIINGTDGTSAFFLIDFFDSDGLNITNKLQQTPLHLATIRCQPEVVRRLLDRGARRIVHDKRGNTPLHIACKDGHLQCVEELTKTANSSENLRKLLEAPNYEGQTCLHLATDKNHLNIVRHLVENCEANVNQKEFKRGRTILHQAVESSNVDLVLYLLGLADKHELLIDEQTYDGYTAYMMALLTRHTGIAHLLATAGAQQIDPDMHFES